MENLADDPDFISAIVQEVKSQGLFDNFRKECLADVDTKPAYQNLRQRVESTVSKFLAQQTWTDNIRHKNQLRERLRKHVIESGFLDTGVERIVDQVVNPKISTVFHPKIEEIVYNYLGIEKPKPVLNGDGGDMDVQTDFLPEDLEAVSPDSDKKSSSTSSDIAIKPEPNANDGELNESKEAMEDFESPAFEPLETRPPSQVKNESNDSHASAISGLTSQESVGSEIVDFKQETSVTEDDVGEVVNGVVKDECNGQDEEPSNEASRPVQEISPEVTQNDSQLSQVSSNSRLSIITNSEGVQQQQQQRQPDNQLESRLDITEEAQMPRFNENSNEEDGELPDSGGDEDRSDSADGGDRGPHKSNFDLRKESYEFKGTERNKRYLDVDVEKPNVVEPATIEHKAADGEEKIKEEPQHVPEDQPKQCPLAISLKCEETSSHSERSLRICEDSTLEQKAAAPDTYSTSLQENCESVKTPLNDEHSTQSAPDVDKMDSSQVVEVVSLAAVQQHSDKEKKSERHHRDRDHKSRSSSSRDRRSHSSSKHGSSSSSGSGSGSGSSSRKLDHRDRKSENGNGSSKRSNGDKRKEDDDHYSAHEKPVKKRRSTDRDSNDGAESGKSAKAGDENNGSSGKGTNTESAKSSQSLQKRGSGSQDKLNESLESSFEGFDEEQIGKKERRSATPKKSDKGSKSGVVKSADKGKSSKKPRKSSDKSPPGKSAAMTMDVFSFSFDKPAKLVNGEIVAENSPEPEPGVVDELREDVDVVPSQESIGNFDGEIVLDPAELAQAFSANENAEQVTSSVDDNALESGHAAHSFPTTDPADLVTLASQPIVVDQMLSATGDNMDLELLIGEKQLRGDESTMGTIQKGLDVVKNKIRKPKIASNFSEACKLMKVRRQIERQEKKKREQAMVLAKKLINENGSAMEEDQGIELEFVCDSTRNNSAPIISSPVRQKSKLNDEQSLLYFPEESEVYPVNENLREFLKQKTEKSTFAEDYAVECLKIKLHSLQAQQKEPGKALFPDTEEDEIMAVEITEIDDISSDNCTVVLERINMNSPKWQKLRAPSVDSDGAKTQDTVSSLEVPPIDAAYEEMSQSKPVEESSTTETKVSEEPEGSANLPTVRGGVKPRRVGLSRPKGATLNNNTTAILKVDIADVKTSSPAPDRKSNSDIKAQRYTASDLYKPTLNGLRTRTRTRTGEGFSM